MRGHGRVHRDHLLGTDVLQPSWAQNGTARRTPRSQLLPPGSSVQSPWPFLHDPHKTQQPSFPLLSSPLPAWPQLTLDCTNCLGSSQAPPHSASLERHLPNKRFPHSIYTTSGTHPLPGSHSTVNREKQRIRRAPTVSHCLHVSFCVFPAIHAECWSSFQN